MRKTEILNDNWQIGDINNENNPIPNSSNWENITLPNVWNVNTPSVEGAKLYRYTFSVANAHTNKYFIAFNAVAGVCKVWLNEVFLGEHRGGYARFSFSLDEALQNGHNELIVLADNTRFKDIIPLGGDFSNFGGIYREVELICVENNHFDLLYYGTNGLDVDCNADGTVIINSRTITEETGILKYTILYGETVCAQIECSTDIPKAQVKIENPKLWNGRGDSHLYHCRGELFVNGICVDTVELPFGFREVKLCAENGFFLNDKHMKINGVAKHQDREGVAYATTAEHLEEDMQIIKEVGANAIRLSHYQHSQYFYDLCDSEGMVVWAEIPMLGMEDGNTALQENACQQLKELILQCKHHPSICFWGVQNEIAMMGESLEMYRKTQQLHDLAKEIDPSRITVGANLYCVKNNSQLNFITDMVGYNIYFGWYYGEMEEYESFFKSFHEDNPQVPLGVSEYGVDCSVTLHSLEPKRKDYSEEFQCLYHETVYPIIQKTNYLWGSFVWNMFDFGSAIRDEGGVKGKNCKGLVSYDRKMLKDSFYYYKAQWSTTPFLYIAQRKFIKRCQEVVDIKVYSNLKEITLVVDGETYIENSQNGVFLFNNVPLENGETVIKASANGLVDEIVLERVDTPEASYTYNDPNPEINVKNWFTLSQSEEDLFPEDRYSIMDEMGTLLKNEKVCQLLENMVPQIMADPRSKLMPSITLLRIVNRISGQLGEDLVKELNEKLNEISKN